MTSMAAWRLKWIIGSQGPTHPGGTMAAKACAGEMGRAAVARTEQSVRANERRARPS